MAAMMAIFMLSLGGLPVTGGFIGKYFLFGGLIQQGATDGKTWYYWLAGWAIINTVVSFFYYFRFIKVMYLGDRIADNRPLALSPALQISLIVCLIGVIGVGILPDRVLKLTRDLVGTSPR
jgi:NADH-quinone oxidoreductase subunit N